MSGMYVHHLTDWNLEHRHQRTHEEPRVLAATPGEMLVGGHTISLPAESNLPLCSYQALMRLSVLESLMQISVTKICFCSRIQISGLSCKRARCKLIIPTQNWHRGPVCAHTLPRHGDGGVLFDVRRYARDRGSPIDDCASGKRERIKLMDRMCFAIQIQPCFMYCTFNSSVLQSHTLRVDMGHRYTPRYTLNAFSEQFCKGWPAKVAPPSLLQTRPFTRDHIIAPRVYLLLIGICRQVDRTTNSNQISRHPPLHPQRIMIWPHHWQQIVQERSLTF